MCGRYTLTATGDKIAAAIQAKLDSDQGTGRYNIAPTEQVLTVTQADGERRAELMRWGLVPSWAKIINARLETAATTPAYRGLVPKASRRALLVSDGWYEWLKVERRGEPRQPFHFRVDDGAVFAFAALWTPAKIDGVWIHSVTLLTCDSASNPIAAAIHDRMPVILADPAVRRAWLDPDVGEDALELCGPPPTERLSAHPANPKVNKAGDLDGPELLTV
jgi:putative SOS response-associated peptidase YedK